mmetsp:Transcript_1964/g.8240  ORF Transcript_1964/g.8240 Transcript_1964/m.8240 type:complete len:211 (-) Transcript_1964:893-1525(-)
MFFQDFLGGRTENTMPSAKGSMESTSSSSASPPRVIIWYISFSLSEMMLKPAMNSSSLFFLSSSNCARVSSRCSVTDLSSLLRSSYSPIFTRYASMELISGFISLSSSSRAPARRISSAASTVSSCSGVRSSGTGTSHSAWSDSCSLRSLLSSLSQCLALSLFSLDCASRSSSLLWMSTSTCFSAAISLTAASLALEAAAHSADLASTRP